MKQAERHLSDGVHPRLLCEGIELAKTEVLKFVDNIKMKKDCLNHDLLVQVRAVTSGQS
jgi:T-complex protein 1 subunit zeta